MLPVIAVAVSVSSLFIGHIYTNYECCNKRWISFDRTGFADDLEKKVFGQHIASRIMQQALKGFMNDNNPRKPLVLSLHGWTGTGKNLVSVLVAKNIYRKGMESSFVHLFVSTLHFPHASLIETYKSQLQQWIRGNVTQCERSMFIFDEMDKMHPALINAIKPFLDNYEKLDGVSYRKAIFIFLSNAGGNVIVQTTLDFWKKGRDRSEIRLKDLETTLLLSVFNNKNSGFWHSHLIERNLVDFFVPFLPLELHHVFQCVMAEMKARGLKPNRDVAEQLARDLAYFPQEERAFSVSGWFADDLEKKVFGQHIASRIMQQALKGFMNDNNPKKPLVLSLHGWTGTGKNLVTSLVAKNIYKKGMESSFVHLFVSTLHFPHASLIETYKSQLQQWIRGNVTQCERSMFIFDEMDKMHPALINAIKPFLDNYEKLDGVSYRKAIFIFLSNAGGNVIVQTTLDFWKKGQDRSEIRLKDLETTLLLTVFSRKNSGFWHSHLIHKNLVDFFVPFLPLEFLHVFQCVMAEMKARGLKPNWEVAVQLARDLAYFPQEERVFSVSGCRKVNTHLNYYAYY